VHSEPWPKTFSGNGRSVYRTGNSEATGEGTVKLTFDKTRTFVSNFEDDDIEDALDRLETSLAAQGYVEQ